VIFNFVIALLGGMLGHLTKPIIDRTVKYQAWNSLTNYTVGMTLIYPFIETAHIWFLRSQGIDDPDTLKKARQALRLGYFGSALPFGMGVALMRMIRELFKKTDDRHEAWNG
jgi:hypothetical protein